jgi:3-oxoacyl-[acyl-carrier protein] reductase
MITVEETWYLSSDAAKDASGAMQAIEDVVGPMAHEHPGWCGHASFLQDRGDPARVLIVYPWRSMEDHHDLLAREGPYLSEFYAKYCTRPRTIRYYSELAHH